MGELAKRKCYYVPRSPLLANISRSSFFLGRPVNIEMPHPSIIRTFTRLLGIFSWLCPNQGTARDYWVPFPSRTTIRPASGLQLSAHMTLQDHLRNEGPNRARGTLNGRNYDCTTRRGANHQDCTFLKI